MAVHVGQEALVAVVVVVEGAALELGLVEAELHALLARLDRHLLLVQLPQLEAVDAFERPATLARHSLAWARKREKNEKKSAINGCLSEREKSRSKRRDHADDISVGPNAANKR